MIIGIIFTDMSGVIIVIIFTDVSGVIIGIIFTVVSLCDNRDIFYSYEFV